MDFYKVVKYVLMGLLVLVLAVAVMNAPDTNQPSSVQQPVVNQQPGQSKFNF